MSTAIKYGLKCLLYLLASLPLLLFWLLGVPNLFDSGPLGWVLIVVLTIALMLISLLFFQQITYQPKKGNYDENE